MEELGGAALIGSIASTAGNLIANGSSFAMQQQLNKQKYQDMLHYARSVGATPTSMVSGVTGSAGGTMPMVSTSNNPFSDFGHIINEAGNVDAAKRQAVAAENQSQAALTTAETERMLGLMRLKFEPGKYLADIQKSLAQAFESTKNAFLHGSMSKYYKELVTDLQKVRPWKIAGLRQSLLNDMATYDKIVQETKTSKAQESYFRAGSEELNTRSDVNRATSYHVWNQGLNESLRGYQIQWQNSLLTYGIDPNKSFWENTGRLMYTNPRLFKQRMNMFLSSLNIIDDKLQLNLGEHYKRNIAGGVGLYYLNKIHQSNANNRAYRGAKAAETISRFIPFLNIPGVPSVGVSGPGVDWWLKD